MKGKLIVITSSLLVSTFLVSGGYGLWHEKLTIKGRIEVIDPELQIETSIPMILNNINSGGGGSSSGDTEREATDITVPESDNSSLEVNSPSEENQPSGSEASGDGAVDTSASEGNNNSSSETDVSSENSTPSNSVSSGDGSESTSTSDSSSANSSGGSSDGNESAAE